MRGGEGGLVCEAMGSGCHVKRLHVCIGNVFSWVGVSPFFFTSERRGGFGCFLFRFLFLGFGSNTNGFAGDAVALCCDVLLVVCLWEVPLSTVRVNDSYCRVKCM